MDVDSVYRQDWRGMEGDEELLGQRLAFVFPIRRMRVSPSSTLDSDLDQCAD